MPKQRSRDHLEDTEWNSHKDAIRKLYITEKIPLEGSDGVVEKMQELYGFSKTPRQYQAWFKEWGFRKNRRGVEWKIVARKIAARKKAGKESTVYLEGNELPKTIVDKQTYRNSYDLAFKQYKQGSMPDTPEGFVLLTPVAEDREQFQTFNLPFMEFEATIRLKGIAFTSPIDLHNIHDIRPSQQISRYPSSASSEFRTPSEDVLLFESSQITELHQNTAKMHYSIIIPTLRSVLPTTALREYSESNPRELLPIETMREAHLKLLCFSVANNFAGITGLSLEMIWDFVRNEISIPSLMELAPGPTAKALAEKLFNCAIESGDLSAVEYLLQKQYVNVNNQVCIINDFRYTPIERSTMLHDIAMTKLLIRYKANINKTYRKDSHKSKGALERAIGTSKQMKHGDPALVQILLDSGANCSSDLLKAVIRAGDTRVAKIILLTGSYYAYGASLKLEIFCLAVEYLDIEIATRIFHDIVSLGIDINHGIDMNHGICSIRLEKLGRTVLDVAAERGYFSLVQIILDYGASLTECTLIFAIKSANMDMVRYLLHKGAKIDGCIAFDGSCKTPYSEAIRSGNIDILQLLEDRGALYRITEERRFRAAVCAASQVGDVKILKSLIKTGAVGREESFGLALKEAVMAGWEEVALLLIEAGAYLKGFPSSSSYESPLLCEALKRKMIGVVRALLNAGADSFVGYGKSALNIATEWGDHSIIKDLIFAGADVNNAISAETPLSVAVRKNDMELIQLLLAKGADVNSPAARNNTALAAAISRGNIYMVRFLLEENADPDDSKALLKATSQSSDLVHILLEVFTKKYPCGKRGFGSEAILKSIQENNGSLTEALLKANVDIDRICWEGETGKTPLALAIEKRSLGVVQRLLDRKVDLNDIIMVTRGGNFINTRPPRLTALLVAVRTKDPQMVQLFINKGADVNLAATRGVKHTPLQMAAQIGSLAIVQILLKNSAEVNAQPAYDGGATALQWAAIGGFIGIAEELLKRGADVNAPPAKVHGRTALEGAIEHGRIDMVKFLLDARAEFKGPGDHQYERAMKYARDNGHRALAEMLESYSKSRQNTQAEYINTENN